MRKISIFAIFCGALIGVLVTFLVQIPLTLYIKSVVTQRGIPESLMHQAIQGETLANPKFYLIQILVSTLSSIFGGYFSARIAKNNLLANSTLSATLRFLFGVYSIENIFVSLPLFLSITTDIISPVFGFIGGYLRLKECQRKIHT